jgi:hypothetical protein
MSKKPIPEGPEYLQRLIEKTLANGIKPGVHHVIVEHDDTCPMINGGTHCTCKPEITICEGSA